MPPGANQTRTRNQERAQAAWGQVQARSGQKGEKEFKQFCKAFPALLHSSGLCQALAFCEAKGHSVYLSSLSAVVGLEREVLHARARETNLSEYRWLSQEALTCATWLARYADALLDGGDPADGRAANSG
jgi:CRISPR-associated protein Cmr5